MYDTGENFISVVKLVFNTIVYVVVQKIKENCPLFDIQVAVQEKVGSVLPDIFWNSLDNDIRNTRTFDTFKINLKRKVVLAKIPAHFLVGDGRPNVLYARLRRNCSSLKFDLFRSNIITDSRCVCGLYCI
jgi:hypothetical protein